MSYFLSPTALKTGDIIELTGEEARHILLSRRIEIGEIIEVQGPDLKRLEAEVISIEKRSLSIQALKEIHVPEESPLRITIFQALVKEQPLDLIIQKATELGVDKINLFASKNSNERFKDVDKKLTRWNKIAEEAAKQSGRVRGVSVEYIDDFKKIKDLSVELDRIFLLEPISKKSFLELFEKDRVAKSIGILVGPEGGFTEDEVGELSKIRNFTPISIGPRILRADTAAVSSSAIVQALWGDI